MVRKLREGGGGREECTTHKLRNPSIFIPELGFYCDCKMVAHKASQVTESTEWQRKSNTQKV